tara:strand:- start:305 stop:805 length:501 start_codon:yes stop_codon:yes gene_type:complete
MINVQTLLQSYPCNPHTGPVIPCNNHTDFVRLRSTETKEYLAIYILYECEKRVFLPETVLAYCEIPEAIGNEYEAILVPFLERMMLQKDYFFKGELYRHYADEMKELLTDLHEGGNYHLKREQCLKLWVRYRLLFRDELFSTKAVLQANPVLCKQYRITYAGPLIF